MEVDKCGEARRVDTPRHTSVIHEWTSKLLDRLSTHGHIFAQTATLAKTKIERVGNATPASVNPTKLRF